MGVMLQTLRREHRYAVDDIRGPFGKVMKLESRVFEGGRA
jgi:hypothetical protein